MKKIFIYTACLTLFYLQACKLTDVTDLKPNNKLDENTVVKDIPSAEKLLTGAYYSLRDESLSVFLPLYTGLMGVNVTIATSSTSPYLNNNVSTTDGTLNGSLYSGPYQLIQTANFVIEKTGDLKVDNLRKTEIIAEGKFLRALGHFYILRLFGQFWDLNSKFGIEIKNKPGLPVVARASVKDTYDFILEDLDAAIKGCPEYKTGVSKGYATKLAAKALKSKVLLYKKDYAGAAALAKEVMTGPATLTNNFVTMFQNEKYLSDEVILGSIIFANNNDIYYQNGKVFYWSALGYILSPQYITLLKTDPRKAIIVKNSRDTADPEKWRGNGKFIKGVEGSRQDTEYYIRLAEVYLIYAEAEARRDGGNLDDALGAMNTLRAKRGALTVSAEGKTQLLALIRTEKQLELAAESGEDWFDIVRYVKHGDLTASIIKSTLTDENKLILPIPQVTVDASNNLIKQNPGY